MKNYKIKFKDRFRWMVIYRLERYTHNLFWKLPRKINNWYRWKMIHYYGKKGYKRLCKEKLAGSGQMWEYKKQCYHHKKVIN